jgi:hypothetical protein
MLPDEREGAVGLGSEGLEFLERAGVPPFYAQPRRHGAYLRD